MDFNIEKAKILLNQIEELDKKYQDRVEKQEKSGKNYNVFYVLRLWSDEVKFHSAFIADLLNPNGWHGQGDVFLKEFLSILGYKDLITENANVEIEKSIGKVTEEEGGRLDISIELKKNYKNDFLIIIENKIHAEDQPNQLIRYKNYAEEQFPDGHIILYLTPDGRDPNEKSVGFNPEDESEGKPFWRNISYSYLIKEWLKRCIELMKEKENIKIVIWQYLALLLELTGQGGDCIMSKEIQKFLLKGHNLLYAEKLRGEIDGAKQNIIDDKLKPLLEDISVKNCSLQEFEFNKNNSRIKFKLGKGIVLWFEFQGKFGANLYYGIRADDSLKKETCKIIKGLIIGKQGNTIKKKSEYWLWGCYCDENYDCGIDMRNWNGETYDMILNSPKKIKQYFETILNDTIKALKENNLIK